MHRRCGAPQFIDPIRRPSARVTSCHSGIVDCFVDRTTSALCRQSMWSIPAAHHADGLAGRNDVEEAKAAGCYFAVAGGSVFVTLGTLGISGRSHS
jgi:hypothetical protein